MDSRPLSNQRARNKNTTKDSKKSANNCLLVFFLLWLKDLPKLRHAAVSACRWPGQADQDEAVLATGLRAKLMHGEPSVRSTSMQGKI
jgi:hypothetical protein